MPYQTRQRLYWCILRLNNGERVKLKRFRSHCLPVRITNCIYPSLVARAWDDKGGWEREYKLAPVLLDRSQWSGLLHTCIVCDGFTSDLMMNVVRLQHKSNASAFSHSPFSFLMVISGFIDIDCRTACYKSGFKWQIHLWGSWGKETAAGFIHDYLTSDSSFEWRFLHF